MRSLVLVVAVAVTGCASDGWRYMAPAKGTYSLSVDGAKNNPAGGNSYLTPGTRTTTTHEYRYGQPTGRTFESR
jgi:hypothetical protein